MPRSPQRIAMPKVTSPLPVLAIRIEAWTSPDSRATSTSS
jgi:hypothetical protein